MATIKEQIEYYNKRYYDDGVSEITDAEYDALVARSGIEMDYVPGSAKEGRVKHTIPMLSLDKVTATDGLLKVAKTFGPVIVMEPKYDGLTIVHYPDGKAVTRGNGEYGEDVTATIGHILPKNKTGYPVRGEFLLSNLEGLNYRKENPDKEIKNLRNVAAGFVNQKDKKAPYGHFLAYELVGSTEQHSKQIVALQRSNYETAEMQIVPIAHLEEAVAEWDERRNDYKYQTDGIVFRSNAEDARRIFGETGHHPKDAVAFKFESPKVETTLLDVVWQVGRTGKVVPVAILEPVEILDTVVERATLHNFNYIQLLNIAIGAKVTLTKAHDIIPAIIACDNNNPLAVVQPLASCPVCNTELEIVETQQFCRNDNCTSKLPLLIAHMATRDAFDIEGLSEKTVEKIIETLGAANLGDVFRYKKDDFLKLEGFADKSAENLYNNIQAAKQQPLHKFLYGLGVPKLGKTVSKQLAQAFKELTTIALLSEEDLTALPGIGKEIAAAVISDAMTTRAAQLILAGVLPLPYEEEEVVTTGEVFCLTGKFSQAKSIYEDALKEKGHLVESSLKANVTTLVAASKESTSSKMTKAKEKGIRILDEQELKALLEE